MNSSFFNAQKQHRINDKTQRLQKEQQYNKLKRYHYLPIKNLPPPPPPPPNLTPQPKVILSPNPNPKPNPNPNPTQFPQPIMSSSLRKPSRPVEYQHNIIINVIYQYSYTNATVSGFGDFLRGMFFMLQFSEKYNIFVNFEIYNHPIKQYLTHFKENLSNMSEAISAEIQMFETTNYEYNTRDNKINYSYVDIDNKIITFFNNLNDYNGNKYVYLTTHPDEKLITQSHKNKICEIIKPSPKLIEATNQTLFSLNLKNYNFKVIHLRTYDNNTNTLSPHQLIKIIQYIKHISSNTFENILLMSSSNRLKTLILKHIPTLKTYFCDITHIADKNTNNDDNILNTLNDFFIMSRSNQIYSLSVYGHGSGFSKWCSVAYNIPYVCYYIN